MRPEQTAADPSVAAHEANVLQLVERIATPTPHLIGVDPTGDVAAVPAMLMTELPGRPERAARQRWMRQLVDVLVDIHDIDPGAADGVRRFAAYAHSSYALPKWATKPTVWEQAIEIFHGPVLDNDHTFIHRDFYPGNVLWHRRTVSGLVDWEAASIRPRSMDVAHCRINLLYDGLDAADIFTRTWEQRTGRLRHHHRPPRLRTPPAADPTQAVRHRDDAPARCQRDRRPVDEHRTFTEARTEHAPRR